MTDTKRKFKIRLRPTLVVLIGFVLIILVGAFFLCLPISNKDGNWLNFVDSLFTSTSAVCVTGLAVRPTALSFSGFGQAVLLLLIQAGGLGFMTLATLIFILIRKRITLKDRIAVQEALGQDYIKGVVRLVCHIAIMTGVIELSGMILLLPFMCIENGAIGIWQSVFLSVSAFCNAGFDILGTPDMPYASLIRFKSNPFVLLIIGALIILGGLGFNVIKDILACKFRFRRYQMHTKVVLVVTAILLVFGTFFLLGSEFNSAAFDGMNGGEKLLNSFFQSITARTAGFNTVDQNALSGTGKIMTCVLMVIGASPGGTGGGIKTSTFAVIVLMVLAGLRGKDEIVINMHTIKPKTGLRAVAVMFIAFMFIVFGTLIISLIDRELGGGDVLFEVISAIGTVGLSIGITPLFSPPSQIILILLMLLGRLGALSIGMIFAKREKSSLKFPPANIMIG